MDSMDGVSAGACAVVETRVERIRRLMGERGWRANELAYRAQVSVDVIRNWLMGRTPPRDVEYLAAISYAFGVPLAYLVEAPLKADHSACYAQAEE